MAHDTPTSYGNLVKRINAFPQGAPPSDALYAILSILVDEREAGLMAQLPIKPFTAKKAAAIWKKDIAITRKILDELAHRAILIDIEHNGDYLYCLPPPMAGFFEFSLMRIRDDLDQKYLSELYYQYMNVEEEFIRELMVDKETPIGRIFPNESVLPNNDTVVVLDYERASEVIKTASHIGLSLCYCRHKMTHLEKACDAPLEICMTFNTTAASLIRHGHAKRIDSIQCLELLSTAYENNLIQFGENVKQQVSFICNCCGCCCEAMLAFQRFAYIRNIHSNFLADIHYESCSGCGKCVSICPIHVIDANKTETPSGKKSPMRPVINTEMCLGCGICVRNCPTGALQLHQRDTRVLTPVNSVHRVILMALEKGTLQDVIFDNKAMWSHRVMAAILGAVLKLDPVQRALANKQLKSRYLESLILKLKTD